MYFAEASRAKSQSELSFEAGGHDMGPIAPHAPLAHLASWLDATEGESPMVTKQELREGEALGPFVQRLYAAVWLTLAGESGAPAHF